jgi:hypothetical protein
MLFFKEPPNLNCKKNQPIINRKLHSFIVQKLTIDFKSQFKQFRKDKTSFIPQRTSNQIVNQKNVIPE